MALVTIETIWIDRIVLMLSAAHNSILLVLLIRQLNNRGSKKPMPKHAKFMNLWALLSIICNIAYCTLRTPVSFGAFTADCTLQSALMATLWTLGKLCLYMFFTSRLDVAFRYSSSFRMSRLWFFILYGTISLGWLTQQVLISIFWGGQFIDLYGTRFCATAAPLWMYWGGLGAWDFFISTLLCGLFVSRLWKAQSRRTSVSQKETNSFLHTLSKYLTITVVGVLSTLISMTLVGFTSWISLVAIDTSVNTWCVFLMYGKNQHLFTKLCLCCHKSVQYCCIGYVTCHKAIIRKKRRRRATKMKGRKGSSMDDNNDNNNNVTVAKLSVGAASPASPNDDGNNSSRDVTYDTQTSLTGKFPDFNEIFKIEYEERSRRDAEYTDNPSGGTGGIGGNTVTVYESNGNDNDNNNNEQQVSTQMVVSESTNNSTRMHTTPMPSTGDLRQLSDRSIDNNINKISDTVSTGDDGVH